MKGIERKGISDIPEPAGELGAMKDKPLFVIQKHDASNLHYDFRMEVNGVLRSWVLPKGPSIKPGERRLAIPVEDHPIGYADFEGRIPEGQYGAGTVIVWDRGTYSSLKEHPDVATALEEGHLDIWLEGEKLKGGFALIRTGSGEKPRWLLVKMRDEEASATWDPLSSKPRSVLSGKTIEEMRDVSGDDHVPGTMDC